MKQKKEYIYLLRYFDAEHRPHDMAEINFISDDYLLVKNLNNKKTKVPPLNIQSLWLRIPANIRLKHKDKREAFDEFVNEFKGRVAIDRFQFIPLIKEDNKGEETLKNLDQLLLAV